jgi:hypothetical protein
VKWLYTLCVGPLLKRNWMKSVLCLNILLKIPQMPCTGNKDFRLQVCSISRNSLSVGHTFSRQTYKKKSSCLLWYGNFSSHHTLKIESCNFLIIMYCSTSLPDDETRS